jgi:hypothetical protein
MNYKIIKNKIQGKQSKYLLFCLLYIFVLLKPLNHTIILENNNLITLNIYILNIINYFILII